MLTLENQIDGDDQVVKLSIDVEENIEEPDEAKEDFECKAEHGESHCVHTHVDDEYVDGEIEFPTNEAQCVDAQVNDKGKNDNGIKDANTGDVKETIEVAWHIVK